VRINALESYRITHRIRHVLVEAYFGAKIPVNKLAEVLDLSIHTVGPMLRSVRKYLKDEQENARERVDSKLCKFTTGG